MIYEKLAMNAVKCGFTNNIKIFCFFPLFVYLTRLII